MADLNILSAKFAQPLRCRCGHVLTASDVRDRESKVEIVCLPCGASVLEIECEVIGDDPWD
jgi:hypothetical protein